MAPLERTGTTPIAIGPRSGQHGAVETTFQVRGLAFPAIVMGPEDGPPVVCLHGFPDTRHGFFGASARGPSFGATLAAAGFRVVAPAMRGTEPGCIPADGDYSPGALADDVLAIVDAVGPKPTVVGNDWGALATYLACARAPHKIERAVTLGIPHPGVVRWTPMLLWRARHMLAFQAQGLAARRLAKDDFAVLERLYHRWSPTWRLPADALAEVKAAYRQPGVLAAALAPYAALRKHLAATQRELAAPIRVPLLALYGGGDPSVPPAAYARAARRFSGPYRHEAVPTIGHFMQREDPIGVAERVIAFARS